jgi:enamine deaminase RidA (YjgF/YER057c/UK114 family)
MKAQITNFNPDGLGKPLGLYCQISRVKAASEYFFIAGQLATSRKGEVVGNGDFESQMRQVFANIKDALASVDCGWANVAKFTTYLVHSQDIERFMTVRKELFAGFFPNGAYPPNTLLIVDRLVKEDCLIEVETVAAS